MHSHVAGALHSALGNRGSTWLHEPGDANALAPQLWPHTVRRGDDGSLHVGGVSVHELARTFGTPAYVLDEADLRARCRSFVAAFAGWDIYYASKAFLCKAVARIVAEEGLLIDVCTGGELAVAQAAGISPDRIAYHGNNKSVSELSTALDVGVGRIIVDSFDELDRLTKLAQARGARPAVMIRVTVGVEAHTHDYIATAHEDQKFGFSLYSGAALRAAIRVLDDGVLDLRGLHTHIGSQIFDVKGFEVSAERVIGLHAQLREMRGVELPELDLGGGFGIAYTTRDTPAEPGHLAERLGEIVHEACSSKGLPVPRLAVEPGRAIIGPAMFTLYEVGTVKHVDQVRTYVSVDGGMGENIRTPMYDATFIATLAARRSDVPPILVRVVGKYNETADVLVQDGFLPGDVHPGDLLAVPATGGYCRSMASNYNHLPRPPVVAVSEGGARVVVRRESEADVMLLDVG